MYFLRFFSFYLLLSFYCFSQIEEPVIWNSNIQKISDHNYLITIEAYIDDNWRLYSQNLPKGGAEPTEFVFRDKKGYELLGVFREIFKKI